MLNMGFALDFTVVHHQWGLQMERVELLQDYDGDEPDSRRRSQ